MVTIVEIFLNGREDMYWFSWEPAGLKTSTHIQLYWQKTCAGSVGITMTGAKQHVRTTSTYYVSAR